MRIEYRALHFGLHVETRLKLAASFGAVIFWVCSVACSRNADKPADAVIQPNGPTEGAVEFDIVPVAGRPGQQRWVATYASSGKTAKFRIELGPAKPDGDKDFLVSSGIGHFLAEPGSDARGLLIELKKALEAKSIPHNVQRVAALPFEFVVIGENLSLARDGGFNEKPPGNWTAIKIFLAKGEGEVFLNLDVVDGKGEFSIKDQDYGDTVVAELAKVL